MSRMICYTAEEAMQLIEQDEHDIDTFFMVGSDGGLEFEETDGAHTQDIQDRFVALNDRHKKDIHNTQRCRST